MKTEVSVVIPVYNGESCILELYRRVSSSLEEITSYFEIIFVEDCGQDESWNQICQTATSDPKVVGIKFSRNFGQHNAITAGIDASQGVWVVVMDCDLQDLPEDIVDLYKKALEGYSVVLARRSSRKDPVLKKLSRTYSIWSYPTCRESYIGQIWVISAYIIEMSSIPYPK